MVFGPCGQTGLVLHAQVAVVQACSYEKDIVMIHLLALGEEIVLGRPLKRATALECNAQVRLFVFLLG